MPSFPKLAKRFGNGSSPETPFHLQAAYRRIGIVHGGGHWLKKSDGGTAGTGEPEKSATFRVTMKSHPVSSATTATAASSKSLNGGFRIRFGSVFPDEIV